MSRRLTFSRCKILRTKHDVRPIAHTGIKIYAPEPVARRRPRRGYARYAGVIEPPRLDPRAHHRAVRRARAGHREGTVTVARERGGGGGGRALLGAAQRRVIRRLIRVRPARRVCRYIRRIRRVGGDHHERAREHARELRGRVERAGDRRAVSGAVHKTRRHVILIARTEIIRNVPGGVDVENFTPEPGAAVRDPVPVPHGSSSPDADGVDGLTRRRGEAGLVAGAGAGREVVFVARRLTLRASHQLVRAVTRSAVRRRHGRVAPFLVLVE